MARMERSEGRDCPQRSIQSVLADAAAREAEVANQQQSPVVVVRASRELGFAK